MSKFDEVVSRTDTSSLKWDLYKNKDILPFWVADMDFRVAEPIQQAIESRVAHGVFGYTVAPDALMEAVIAHLDQEYNWKVDPAWIVWLPGVVTGLAVACKAYTACAQRLTIKQS